MWTVTKEFSFEAAHSLPHLPKTHKCHRLHGHSYKFTLACQGRLQADNEWVVDYAAITKAAMVIIDELDHENLNDVLDGKTTAENLARYIYKEIKPMLPSLAWVELRETEKTNVIYKP